MWEPPEPWRKVPVAVAEQAHGGGDQDEPHERGIERKGNGDAEAHLLEGDELARGEPDEHDDDDRRRASDEPSGRGDAMNDRVARVSSLAPTLMDAAEQEHLVVHREPE